MLFLDCSGLTTISRYPIKNIKFDVFDDQGAMCDGDFQYLSRKGQGYIQIQPIPNVVVYLSLHFFILRINIALYVTVRTFLRINPCYFLFQIDVINTHTHWEDRKSGNYQKLHVIKDFDFD